MDYWLLCICFVTVTAPALGQMQNQPVPTAFNPSGQPGMMNQNQPGMGGQSQPGMGGQMQPGMGGQMQPGMGGQMQPGMGGQSQPGMGGQSQPGMGGQMQPGMGGQSQPGMGGQNQPGMGGQNQPGMAVQNQPGMVGQNQPGSDDQATNQAQAAEAASQFACASAGRAVVAQCFLQNGGFTMNTVIGLLSNGTQGQLPVNSEQVQTQLCQSEKQIATCVFNGIAQFNGSQQCNTIDAFVQLQRETIGLLNGIQQLCGTSLVPRVSQCMVRLSYDILQCYEKVGLNPSLYSPDGSRMEGAVIGDNREAANMFCKKRRELFACQTGHLDSCPGAQDLQALRGNDLRSLQAGMDVLCKDVDDYVRGLVCFQQPTQTVQECASVLVREMTDVTISQIRDTLDMNDYFVEYCNARLRNLRCDNKAWGGVCEAVAVGLKAEFQCQLLPSRCKDNPGVRPLYDEVCSMASYARDLRAKDSGAASVGAGLVSMLATLGVAVLIMI